MAMAMHGTHMCSHRTRTTGPDPFTSGEVFAKAFAKALASKEKTSKPYIAYHDALDGIRHPDFPKVRVRIVALQRIN